MKELENLRQNIDSIDDKILSLLKDRFKLVEKVGIFKKENNLPILQKKRWEELMKQKLKITKELGLDKNLIKDIWEIIHKSALESEKNVKI